MDFLTNNKKKFKITVDGPDGVGKSLLIQHLAERLRERFARGACFRFEPRYVSPFCDKSRWDRPGIMPVERPSLRDYVNAIKSGEIGWPTEEDNEETLKRLFYLMNESALRIVETRKLPEGVEKEVYLFDRSFVSYAVNQGIELWDSIERYDYHAIIIDNAETIQKNLLKRSKNDPFDDVSLASIQKQLDEYVSFYDRANDSQTWSLIDLSNATREKADYGAKRLISEIFPE